MDIINELAREMYETDCWGHGRANGWPECSEDIRNFWRRKAQIAVRFIEKHREKEPA